MPADSTPHADIAPSTVATAATAALQAQARHYLTGYGQYDLTGLQQLAQVTDWPRLAQTEVERRASSLLQSFDLALLQAIASGQVQLDQVAAEVVCTLHAT